MSDQNPCLKIERALIADMIQSVHESREPRRKQVLARFTEEEQVLYAAWQLEAPARESQEREQAKTTQRRLILEGARIPGRWDGTRFASLERSYSPKAYDRCLEYSQNSCRLDDSPGLILSGPPGTGKTALAVACLREVVERYTRPVRYYKLSAFLQGLRDQFDYRDGEERPDTMHSALRYSLVLFDDIQRQRLTEWGTTVFHDLVDALYDDEARVIFTMNATREEFLDSLDQATAGRIDQMCAPVEVGEDEVDHRYREGGK